MLVKKEILLLSQRRIADVVASCLDYEFEDTVASITNARRIDATDLPGLQFSRRAYKLARVALRSPEVARWLAPSPRSKVVLDGDFELFLPVFSYTNQLYSLATIPNWRQRCGKAACFINDIWSKALPEYLMELLAAFDHVFVGTRNAVEDVARITGRPCTYLPFAVDVLRFTPATPDQLRPIYVCNIGRRSQITHQALLDDAEREHRFYYYDTVAASGAGLKQRTFRVDAPHEHRGLLATLLKHSRFFIAHRAYINQPEFTAGRDEIAARFYEGVAAGAVIIGEAPRTDEFKRQFNWPDAVIHAPFDCPDIGKILADLSSDPERLRAIGRSNARQAALHHDWLHRLQIVFDVLGLKPTEGMQARAQRLEYIASQLQ
jgi:Glycosyl transferases group 1